METNLAKKSEKKDLGAWSGRDGRMWYRSREKNKQ